MFHLKQDKFPWYKNDKITGNNHYNFINSFEHIEKYLSDIGSTYETFSSINAVVLSGQGKNFDYNIASCLMRCYFLKIVIGIAFEEIDEVI